MIGWLMICSPWNPNSSTSVASSAISEIGCNAAGCCEACGQPPTCGQGGETHGRGSALYLHPAAAQLWRRSLLAQGGERALAGTLRTLQPISLIALLATLVLLFGFQGEQIVRQPLIIALLAVPITFQVYLNAGIAYGLNRALGVPHNVACPSALIGASNFFELAVAAAIALFGFQSGAALATVVGVLVEVPVMLSVVRIVLRTRGWYEHARTV